jgi:NAD(P)-dependent dehydrogenase (short-subunit alcohol dehydrogenase family)
MSSLQHAPFAGKVTLVTGAARGIGRVIARFLAQEGSLVVIADLNEVQGRQTCEELRNSGLTALFLPVDLRKAGASAGMVSDCIAQFGRLDLLVNNARAGLRLGLLEESESNWDLCMDVGLKAAFFSSQEAIRQMKALSLSGCIINVGSVAATLVTNESPSYHASKAALMQMTRYLAVHGGAAGVRCNAVLPGLIVQDEHLTRYEEDGNESYRGLVEQYQPLHMPGSSRDVAEAVAFLGNPANKYLNGACLVLDGGATLQEQFGMLLRNKA